MDPLNILIAGGAGAIIWMLVIVSTTKERASRMERLEGLISHAALDEGGSKTKQASHRPQITVKSFYARVIVPLLTPLRELALRFLPTRIISRMQQQIDGAGNPANMDTPQLMLLKIAGLFAGVGVGVGVAPIIAGDPNLAHDIGWLLILTVACSFAPDLWLMRKRRAYLGGIRRSLPDVVDLLCVSMDGGLSFDGSVGYVVTHMKNPLTLELNRYLIDRQIGRRQDEAMRTMSGRTREPDIIKMVEVVVQGEALGTGINRALTAFSVDLRIKRRQRAEKKAHEASMKMLFPMILLIFPAIFMIILGPTVPIFISTFGH